MKVPALFVSARPALIGMLLAVSLCLALSDGFAQPKYRTFSQNALSEKKSKAGKPIAAEVCFTFHNATAGSVNGLVVRCNAHILSVDNTGGFASVTLSDKGRGFTAGGLTVAAGDSVTICLTVDKKGEGAQASNWYWTLDGFQQGDKNSELLPISVQRIFVQPNGGNVLEYLYKRVVRRPAGIVVGIPRPDSAQSYAWIRYMKADRKYFPHNGEPRCFDFIVTGMGGERLFVNELKNPHVKKHDNHLLGELHALKLAVVANDSGVSEPRDTDATPLGDLLYNDGANPGDPFNGMTIRDIIHRADSALTYCSSFDSAGYAALDAAVSRINLAFDGPFVAETFFPFLLDGTHTLADAGFLHPNPAIPPVTRPTPAFSITESMPGSYALAQNYPNPFNPSTTIEFSLPEASIVTLKVYNMLGQEVATILDQAPMDQGEESAVFNASALSSGVYFYRLAVEPAAGAGRGFQQVRRMLLLK